MKSRTKYVIAPVALLLVGEGWLVDRFLVRQCGAEFQTASSTPGESATQAHAAHGLDLSTQFNAGC